jgi:hypothetical protein
MHRPSGPRSCPSPRDAARAQRTATAAAVAGIALLAGGCAATPDLGRTERLPEGTLPPSKEVGPPVNIQPAPLARDEFRTVPRHPHPYAGYGAFGPRWYGPRCFDPLFCGPWGGSMFHGPRGRSGFGLHYRVF